MHADPAEWQLDPWSGEVRDGEIWGRGALDMKGQVAASAVAMASLAREGFEPAGDLIFIAAADEEVGVEFGLSWLCEEHPEAVRAEYSLNEGAGDRVELGGRPFYLASTAEKMSSPFILRVRGRSGHASMPGIADNALVKAATLIERLGEFSPKPRLEPEVEALFEAVTGHSLPRMRLGRGARARVDPIAAEFVEPLVGMTISPTMITASQTRNVIPAVCEVTVDCRLLPGQTQAEAEEAVRELLGEGDYELEWIEGRGGTRSAMEGPLWDAIGSWVARPSRTPRSRRSAWPGSRTATGCVTLSEPSRTGSSRCGTWIRRLRPGSYTRLMSECVWTISSSVSSSCAMRPRSLGAQ